ncbi:MAG: asparagine--tRNA ligase, partial [Clostridia bacterium]|nr:asparagine--tRNA ligase [Clostridia bacterium]
EGAGEMFTVTTLDIASPPRNEDGAVDYSRDFFGSKAGLTVSGQLEAECFALAFGKTYTFGPTFRAENSNTARHASEFWMIEPEMAFCDLAGDMDTAEAMIKYILQYIREKAPQEMAFFNQHVQPGLLERLDLVQNTEFARITYTEAIALLEKSKIDFQYKPHWGCDLQTEHERYLSETAIGRPVFVTDYPRDIKAFYMRQNDDGKTVAAMDLLAPGVGEIIGGSQREDRLDILLARMQEMGMNPEEYSWYLDLRRWGSVPHAGFGLGLERFLMYITGVQNIRDVLPFPRVPGWVEF